MSSSIKKFLNNNWVIALGGGIILIFLTLIITDWYNQNAFSTSFKWICSKIVILLNLELKLWWVLILLFLAKPLKIGYNTFFTRPLLEPQNETQILNHFDNIPDEIDRIGLEVEQSHNNNQAKKSELLADMAELSLNLGAKKSEKYFIRKKNLLEFFALKHKKIVWSWDWKYNNLIDEYEAKNIRPLCPASICNYVPLELTSPLIDGDKWFTCHNCGTTVNINTTRNEVEDLIIERAFKIVTS